MRRIVTPHRRVSSQDTRTPAPTALRPPSREETVAELRAIYILLNHRDINTAKQRLTALGQSLQS